MQQTPKDPTDTGDQAKGRPDSGRDETEAQLEKGMPANQKRGPQPKTDERPVPDQSQHDQ